jgi:hypothetical protein
MSNSPPGYPPPAPYPPPKRPSHKLRSTLLAVVALIGIIAVISAVAGGNKKSATNPPGASSSTSPGVSKGIGANNASGDVKIGKTTYDAQLSDTSVRVTVTNRSSKRSDYLITLALESSDGKTQLDTADLFVQNLEPGQSSPQTGDFLSLNAAPPAGSKVVLQSVERTASS